MPPFFVQQALNDYLTTDLEQRITENQMRAAEKTRSRDLALSLRGKACDLAITRTHRARELLRIGIDVGEWS